MTAALFGPDQPEPSDEVLTFWAPGPMPGTYWRYDIATGTLVLDGTTTLTPAAAERLDLLNRAHQAGAVLATVAGAQPYGWAIRAALIQAEHTPGDHADRRTCTCWAVVPFDPAHKIIRHDPALRRWWHVPADDLTWDGKPAANIVTTLAPPDGQL